MKNHVIIVVVGIFAIAALVVLFSWQAQASRRLGGETCQCFFTDQCRYVNEGFGNFVGYNYHVCHGACAAYGRGWVRDNRCHYPSATLRKQI